MINDTIGFIAANHFRVSNQYHSQKMSNTLLSNDKREEEEIKQVKIPIKIPKVLYEEQQEEDKEFIILKICKSEIDKAIEDLKEHNNLFFFKIAFIIIGIFLLTYFIPTNLVLPQGTPISSINADAETLDLFDDAEDKEVGTGSSPDRPD